MEEKSFQTERLILREIEAGDAKEIVAFRGDPDVFRFFKNPHRITEEEHLNWFENSYLSDDERVDFICIRKDTDEKIGVFGFVRTGDSAEVNYLLSKEAQHKGYASEALKGLMKYVSSCGIRKFTAEIHKENGPSLMLAERLGFKPFSEKVNFVTYELEKTSKMPKILMRADCNPNIGQGHVMRLLSLADAFKSIGTDCAFVNAKDTSPDRIKNRGYEVFVLSTNYDETDLEITELAGICDAYDADLVLVDSYFVSKEYLGEVMKITKTAYMDDVYSFAYPTDLLINYNIYADEKKYKELYEDAGVQCPEMILGPSYVPLRKEFSNIPEREISEKVNKIAVSFGGADPLHMARKFLEILMEEDYKEFLKEREIHMILGIMEPDLELLKEYEKKYSWLKIHVDIPNMKEVLLDMDLAVSAAGSTQYEICACQVPCINFSMADNQLPGGEEFGKRGIFKYAGDVRTEDDFYHKMSTEIVNLAGDFEVRKEMTKKERELTDGNGAVRMAKAVMKFGGWV